MPKLPIKDLQRESVLVALQTHESEQKRWSTVLKADLLMLLAALIWGTTFVPQRLSMNHLGPLTFNAFRFILGGLFLLALRAVYPALSKQMTQSVVWGPSRAWAAGALAGVVLFIAATLQQIAIVTTEVGKTGFLTSLYVIFVPMLALFVGTIPGWGSWLGSLLALSGVFFLSGPLTAITLFSGDGLLIMSALVWALHVHCLGYFSRRVDGLILAISQALVSGALSLVCALIFEGFSWSGVQKTYLAILYGAIMSVGVAFSLQVVAQKHAPATHAAIIFSFEAVFAAVAGWLLLGETLSAEALLGCSLLFAGLIVAQVKP
jgi:drug/metabolite transporter (DMT)-like permease